MSAPVSLEHDEMGRVVGACFESSRPRPVDPAACILAAVDGSPYSLKGIDHLLKITGASAPNLAVHLLTVEHWASKEASQDLPGRGFAHLAEACARLDEAGVPWRAKVVMGDPVSVIIAEAGALHADAVVIGSRGKGAMASLVLGSVAQAVVQGLHAPVWVVR